LAGCVAPLETNAGWVPPLEEASPNGLRTPLLVAAVRKPTPFGNEGRVPGCAAAQLRSPLEGAFGGRLPVGVG